MGQASLLIANALVTPLISTAPLFMLMVATMVRRRPTTRMILVVADPRAMHAMALAAGAKDVWPVREENGWLLGRVVDPFGHHWEIGKPLGPGVGE